MANKIMKFISETLGSVRGLYLEEQPWLVAKDVCKMLELGDAYQAVSRLGEDEKCWVESKLPKDKGKAHRNSTIWLVNESGFYHFFFSCRNLPPNAKEFKKWIGHEVFPAIRRAGAAEIQKCVYVLLMSNSTVKIGHTQDFQRRMRQIEGSSGLSVVKSYHTDYMAAALARKLEGFCHETFADKRVLGEFFNVPFDDAITELQRLTKAA